MATKSEPSVPDIGATVTGSVITITSRGGRSFSLDAATLSPELREAAIMQGLRKKLVDPAALSRDPDTGASATIDDKFDACLEVYERLTNGGPWNKQRGDGSGAGGTGLLVRALMALTGNSEEETKALLESCSDDEVKALRGQPKVAAKMAEFKTVNKSVDLGALSAKFGF